MGEFLARENRLTLSSVSSILPALSTRCEVTTLEALGQGSDLGGLTRAGPVTAGTCLPPRSCARAVVKIGHSESCVFYAPRKETHLPRGGLPPAIRAALTCPHPDLWASPGLNSRAGYGATEHKSTAPSWGPGVGNQCTEGPCRGLSVVEAGALRGAHSPPLDEAPASRA